MALDLKNAKPGVAQRTAMPLSLTLALPVTLDRDVSGLRQVLRLADLAGQCGRLQFDIMANERSPQTPHKEKAPPPKPEKAGRSGEGARSVIPHLRADQKARAFAQIGKRRDPPDL